MLLNLLVLAYLFAVPAMATPTPRDETIRYIHPLSFIAFLGKYTDTAHCLAPVGATAAGSLLEMTDCDGSASQQWILNSVAGGTHARGGLDAFTVRLANTNLCLDAPSAAYAGLAYAGTVPFPASGAAGTVQLQTCSSSAAQVFYEDNLLNDANGLTRGSLRSGASGLCASRFAGAATTGISMYMDTCKASSYGQQWAVTTSWT